MVYFKSTATAITIASNLSKSRPFLCSKVAVRKLENFVDAEHSTPPHILASRGDLHALQDSVKVFGLTLRERDTDSATLLHHGSNACQLLVIQFLIDSGVELDATDRSGNTALHLAATACHADVISLLLESGASCSILNYERCSPLHLAARDMSGKSLRACLSYPIDIFIKGPCNRTIFHILAETDNIEGRKAMKTHMTMQQSGDSAKSLKITDDDGFTPVHLAARKNSYRVLEDVISVWKEIGKSPAIIFDLINNENSTPLHVAVDAGSYEAICILLKYGVCPFLLKEDISPPLHLACSLGLLDIVKAMVQYAGVEILHRLDYYQRSPLHYSALSIHSTSIISYIIEEGTDININQQDSNEKTPLHVSISSGNLAGVKELLERGSDPFLKDKNGSNALHLAILHDRKLIIRELLEVPNCSQLITDINSNGQSPIHIGLKLGLADTMLNLIYPILVQRHCQCISVKDSHGNNYIHLAAASGDTKLLQEFLDFPNSQKLLNDPNHWGSTPLHNAAKKGKTHCISHLLNRGAMVHKCSKGVTPLMLACAEGHIECAKLLYKAHLFQLDWQDNLGDTALHHATRSGCPPMIQCMLDLNSKILHNDHGQSFFDLITSGYDEDCALAVVNHKRWQECLDVISPVGETPMIRLIKRMPAIAKAVLDRCYKKHSSLNGKYCEDFEFKYVLSLDDTQLETTQRDQLLDSPPPPSTLHKFGVESDHDLVTFQRTARRKIFFPDSSRKVSQTMEVLLAMVHHKRVDLLIHPVVFEYLKIKWQSYGFLCLFLSYLVAFFNVIFLTSFVIFGSSPSPPANSSASLLEQDVSNNITVAPNSFQINSVGQVLRWLTVFCNSLVVIVVIVIIVGLRSRCIFLLWHGQLWIILMFSLLDFIFLLHSNPFDAKIVPVGAAASFLAWLVLFGSIQFLSIFGIYVTMFYHILCRAFKVLTVSLVLLMAFALPMFLLGRSFIEFSNLGFSLFSVFGYMLGEIQYSLFVSNDNSNSAVLIFCVTVLAIMMSIVMANLLIGLAVGDIEQIKRNAIYDEALLAVEFFFHLDENLPKFLHRKVVDLFVHSNDKELPRFHRRRVVDGSNLTWWQGGLRSISMLCSKASRERREGAGGTNNAIDIPMDIASELAQIKKKLLEISDIVNSMQEDKDRSFDHRWRSRQLRWQKPESSSASLVSNFSDM